MIRQNSRHGTPWTCLAGLRNANVEVTASFDPEMHPNSIQSDRANGETGPTEDFSIGPVFLAGSISDDTPWAARPENTLFLR